MIKKLVLAIVSTVAFSSLGLAADLLPIEEMGGYKDGGFELPLTPSWSGYYAGLHGGGSWNDARIVDAYSYYGDPAAKTSADGAGALVGAQAGYNVQQGRWVVGLEGDLGYLDLATSKRSTLINAPAADQFSLSADYASSSGLYGDITVRIGVAIDRALVFVKGGIAFLDADLKASYLGQNYTGIPHRFDFSQSDTLAGWTLGAGVEYALSAKWSLQLEYQHFDFGDASYSHNSVYVVNPATGWHSTLTGRADVSTRADAVMIGVKYHLGRREWEY